jgi:hypothetical protein
MANDDPKSIDPASLEPAKNTDQSAKTSDTKDDDEAILLLNHIKEARSLLEQNKLPEVSLRYQRLRENIQERLTPLPLDGNFLIFMGAISGFI